MRKKYSKYIDGSQLLAAFKGAKLGIESFHQDKGGELRFFVSNYSYRQADNLTVIAARLQKIGYAIISAESKEQQNEAGKPVTTHMLVNAVPSEWVRSLQTQEEADA